MDITNERPIIKDGTKYWLLFKKKNQDVYCLGNVQSNKFIKVYDDQLKDVKAMLHLMDGKNTLEAIQSQIHSFDTLSLYKTMCKAGLIKGFDSSYQNNEFELYSFVICKLSTYRLKRMFYLLGKIFTRPIITILLLAFIFVAVITNINSIPRFMTSPDTYRIFQSDTVNLVVYYVISLVSILLHELGHAIVAARYKAPPSTLTVALYLYVTLIVYLTIPGIYTKPPKQRIYIWCAGIYVNAIICATSLVLYSLFGNPIMALTFVVNLTLIIINISPMMPLDGYFIVCTLLKTTNMRAQFLHPFVKRYWRQSNVYMKFYNVFSLSIMLYVAFTQISWVFSYLLNAYQISTTLIQFLYNIRLLLMALIVLIISRVIKWFEKRRINYKLQ